MRFIVVVVMTVMTGLIGDFKQKNHAFVGDCIVSTARIPYYEEPEHWGRLTWRRFARGPNYALVSIPDDDVRWVRLWGRSVLQLTTNFGRTLTIMSSRKRVSARTTRTLGGVT
jgi:hypothetical protein